jgi:formamidopyrimidine-DNA glycosylase
MPELPEVEIMTRRLSRRLRGATIRRLEVCDPKIKLNGRLAGGRIERVWRRGKFIIFDITGRRHLLVHLRMTGWWEFSQPPRYRLALQTSRGAAYFVDSRRFGQVTMVTPGLLRRELSKLGPEPLGRTVDWAVLRRTGRAIKVALLDQRLVAGIGNIYANEALWRAGINPRRRACRLTDAELRRLGRGIVAAMRKGIGYGPRIFEIQQFAVYDRAGQPCRRCGTSIRQITQAQRSTYLCPRCQR